MRGGTFDIEDSTEGHARKIQMKYLFVLNISLQFLRGNDGETQGT